MRRALWLKGRVAVFSLVAAANVALAYARPHLDMAMPDWASTGINDHDLGHGVHMLESFGGNNGVVVGDEGVLLVDAEYPQLNAKMRAAITRISPLPVRYLVDTHWHWDHTGANGEWARSGAVIISSEKTREHITATQAAAHALPGKPFAPDAAALPALTIDTQVTLHIGSNTVDLIPIAPAHTDGDVVVRYREANVIQTGDTFFNGFYPDIDIDHGGTIDGMIAWYDRLYALCDAKTKIIPGHGDVATREDVRTFQAMLRDVRSRVSNAIAAGQSEAELIASHPLDDLDVRWGGNVVKQPYLLAVVYEDLKKRQR